MNEPPCNQPAGRPPPLTDSPWFWLVLFGGMGSMALVAIGPKYGGRQAPIERKYQVQQRLRIPADGGAPSTADAPPADFDYSTADDTIIKLWPIRSLVFVVTVVAAAVLVRQRIAQHRDYSYSAASRERDEP